MYIGDATILAIQRIDISNSGVASCKTRITWLDGLSQRGISLADNSPLPFAFLSITKHILRNLITSVSYFIKILVGQGAQLLVLPVLQWVNT